MARTPKYRCAHCGAGVTIATAKENGGEICGTCFNAIIAEIVVAVNTQLCEEDPDCLAGWAVSRIRELDPDPSEQDQETVRPLRRSA